LKRVSLAQLAAVLQFDSAVLYILYPCRFPPISWGAPSQQLGVSIMEALKQLKNCLWEIE